MRRPIRLLLDADGVLLDFAQHACRAYRTETGREVNPKALEHWYFTDHLEFVDKEEKHRFENRMRAVGFCLTIPPTPGAKEAMKELLSMDKERRIELHIVTSPLGGCPTWTHERELSLFMNFGLDHSRVHHSQTKYVFSGDLFVDDKPANVISWIDHNSNGAGFLWDTLGNQSEKELRRLKAWGELIEIIKARLRP
jgi:5'(3')-deoxyribonucleotidase